MFSNSRLSPKISKQLSARLRLNELLQTVFNRDGLSPNDAHRIAAKLFSRILTTNYDSLFEDAAKQVSKSPVVIARDVNMPSASLPNKTIIYKLHGDLSTPDRIVITQRDYSRVPLNDGLRTELRSLILTSHLVFVGYALGDSDLLFQIEFSRDLLGGDLPKSYAVLPGAEKDQLFVKRCDADNIDLLSITALEFLQDLEKLLQSFQAPANAVATHYNAGRSSPHVDDAYRSVMREEFKWIDFKGIPVLGGQLRISIDDLFVPLSAVAYENAPPTTAKASKDSPRSSKRTHLPLLEGMKENQRLFDILKTSRRLIVLGDPGSGKTTFLRYIGYELCSDTPKPNRIGLDKVFLPIYIPLRQYASYLKNNPHHGLREFLGTLLESARLGEHLSRLHAAVTNGLAILLLDGLDEVASQQQRVEVANHVVKLAAQYKECPILVTSRRVGFPKDLTLDGFAKYVVNPFSDQEIEKFLDCWCKATLDDPTEKLKLLDAIHVSRVRALAQNPLLLTILARVYKAYRNLPERRAQLYGKCIEALLTTWDLVRDLPPVFEDIRDANRVMGHIAMWIHKDQKGQFVSRDALLEKLAQSADLASPQQAAPLLTQIEERSGLLRELGLDQYAFTHLTFQEYYTARELASESDPFKRLRPFLKDARWQEVISLTAGLLDDLGKQPVTAFLDHFIEHSPPKAKKLKPLQQAKFNHLITCLKDKVEPAKYVEDYVYKTLKEVMVERHLWDYHFNPSFREFSRCEIGKKLWEEALQIVMNEKAPANDRVSALIFGYNMSKESAERIPLFVEAARAATFPFERLGGIPTILQNLISTAGDEAIKRRATEDIRSIDLQRRLKLLEADVIFESDENERVLNLWLSSPERSYFPQVVTKKVGALR